MDHVLIPVNLIVSQNGNSPCIEIRKSTIDFELIKYLIQAAVHERPIIVYPTFSNKIKALNTLVEKGIIYFDKEINEYIYNI